MQQEKIVEIKKCKHCNTSFEITDKDLEFYDKVSPIFSGKKYSIPTPTLCPDCSIKRKLSFRNDRKLYKTIIGGKEYISMYNNETEFTVIPSDVWWNQKYNITFYDYDFNISFFEQFGKLIKIIPHPHILNFQVENCDYTNFNAFAKNGYLCVASDHSENTYYSYKAERCLNCIDCLFIVDSQNCSNIIHSSNCFNVHFSIHCQNCTEGYFLDNCIGCQNCYNCSGLKNNTYCIDNTQYTKEEYENKLSHIKFKGFKDLMNGIEKFNNLKKTIVKPINYNFNSNNSTGEYIVDSDNCKNCYIMSGGCKNCKNIFNGFPKLIDSQNCCYCGDNANLIYETLVSGDNNYKNAFCNIVISNCTDLYYCDFCVSGCKNCFGCVGLHNKSYCILNKQYTKEEYEELVPKIIEHMKKTGEWGEFFPSFISPFGYNETVAQEYFPLLKEEAIEKGFNWSDYETLFPKVEKIIPANKLPDSIADIPDDILNWAIECEVTKKPFIIIKQELEFYRKYNLPIPRRHPDQRHLDRMGLRNPRKLFDRKCDKCEKNMKTTYSPERKEIVYCEECYNREIY